MSIGHPAGDARGGSSREHRGLAAGRPAVHVSPATGWLNDPNGLVWHDGVWHAYYQHHPASDRWGTMHWGHATSRDLVTWTDEPVALHPDRLGAIFSGSVVVDEHDTAGFGPGALVAVFTQDLDGRQRQSLAVSHDGGWTWSKHRGNPVLEADERDFRDPKVIRYTGPADEAWVMCLAVGTRIDVYRSADLRRWEQASSFTCPVRGAGVWECPDLVRLDGAEGTAGWLLTFGVDDGGPHGHSGTVGVLGDFDGRGFVPHGPATLLDHGPDFYALQTVHNAPGPALGMAWLGSWRYADELPSAGRRGCLSLPRRFDATAAREAGQVRSRPAVDLAARGRRHDEPTWAARAGQALHISADGPFEAEVIGPRGVAARISVVDDTAAVQRLAPLHASYRERYAAPAPSSGAHEVVIDHGTIEVFAADGVATISALVFAGSRWEVRVRGAAVLTTVPAHAGGAAQDTSPT